jgi:hypothetical protein
VGTFSRMLPTLASYVCFAWERYLPLSSAMRVIEAVDEGVPWRPAGAGRASRPWADGSGSGVGGGVGSVDTRSESRVARTRAWIWQALATKK